jgi:ABC-type transport system substrate-binding protein
VCSSDLYTTGTAMMDEASVALSQYWNAIGVKVQWQRMDPASQTALVDAKTIPHRVINDSITTFDAESDLMLFWHSTSVRASFYNGKHDALINAAVQEREPAARTQKLQKIVQTIYDEADSIPVYFLEKVYGINTRKISGWDFVEGFAFPRNLEYLHRR